MNLRDVAADLQKDRLLAIVAEQEALIGVADQAGVLQFANPSLDAFCGAECQGKPLVAVLPEQTAEDVRPALPLLLDEAADGGKTAYGSVVFRRHDGASRTFDVTIRPEQESGRVLFIGHDVTERESTIASLDASQTLLESVMDATAEAIVVVDLHGQITSSNAAAKEKMATFLPSTFDGQRLYATDLDGDPIPHRDLPLARAIREEAVDAVIRLETTDGPGEFEVTARPLYDAFGTLIGAVSVWREITDLRAAQQNLSRTEQFLTTVLNASDDGIIAHSFETGARFANPNANRWGLEDAVPLTDLLEHSDSGSGPLGEGLELELDTDEGVRRVLAAAHLIPGASEGNPAGAVITGRDVTELSDHVERLELVTTAMDSTLAAIAITSPEGVIEWTNAAFSSMTALPALLARGKPLSMLTTDTSEVDWEEILAEAHAHSWQGRLEIQTLNRRPITVELSLTSVKGRDGKVTNLVGVLENITNQIKAEERIRYLATHDDLTNLPNRRVLRELLDFALARARRGGALVHLMFLDLDRFKNVNDTFGHPAGDQLIRQAGQRFKAVLRETDAVARLGGDEFAILTEQASKEDAAHLAERVLATIREPFALMGSEVQVSTSIGIATSDGSTPPDDLMDMADVALYQAKDEGRDTYVWFDEELGQRLKASLRIAHELREAIADEQFTLHYQPQYDLCDGSLTGVEALIRWTHPVRGTVPPGQFIEIAEDHGLMRPIGSWVRRTAVQQVHEWDKAGIPVPLIAVNVSPMELRDPTFRDTLLSELEDCPIDVHRLEFELTEAALLSASPSNIEVLSTLRNQGIRVAIDDFGTGYSSLLYLKQFRVNRIKVAQEFVKDLLTNPTSASIVEATLSLARGLDLEVIAEGIEEAEHAAELIRLGCTVGQGYFMGRPMPAEEVPDNIVSHALRNRG